MDTNDYTNQFHNESASSNPYDLATLEDLFMSNASANNPPADDDDGDDDSPPPNVDSAREKRRLQLELLEHYNNSQALLNLKTKDEGILLEAEQALADLSLKYKLAKELEEQQPEDWEEEKVMMEYTVFELESEIQNLETKLDNLQVALDCETSQEELEERCEFLEEENKNLEIQVEILSVAVAKAKEQSN
ncbi:hypothetical protein ACFE04_003476 [Oxalis oulophora]